MVSESAQRGQAYLPESNAGLMHGVSIPQLWCHYPESIHIPYLQTLHLVIAQRIPLMGAFRTFFLFIYPFSSSVLTYKGLSVKSPESVVVPQFASTRNLCLTRGFIIWTTQSQTNVPIHDEFSHMKMLFSHSRSKLF